VGVQPSVHGAGRDRILEMLLAGRMGRPSEIRTSTDTVITLFQSDRLAVQSHF